MAHLFRGQPVQMVVLLLAEQGVTYQKISRLLEKNVSRSAIAGLVFRAKRSKLRPKFKLSDVFQPQELRAYGLTTKPIVLSKPAKANFDIDAFFDMGDGETLTKPAVAKPAVKSQRPSRSPARDVAIPAIVLQRASTEPPRGQLRPIFRYPVETLSRPVRLDGRFEATAKVSEFDYHARIENIAKAGPLPEFVGLYIDEVKEQDCRVIVGHDGQLQPLMCGLPVASEHFRFCQYHAKYMTWIPKRNDRAALPRKPGW